MKALIPVLKKVIFLTGYIINLLKKDPFSNHVYVVVQDGKMSLFLFSVSYFCLLIFLPSFEGFTGHFCLKFVRKRSIFHDPTKLSAC